MKFTAQHRLRQLLPCHHFSGRTHQGLQQTEFHIGQVEQHAVAAGYPGRGIHLQAHHGQKVPGAGRLGFSASAQNRPDSGQQLARVKRLGQIVVRPYLQAHNAIDIVAAGREQQNTHGRCRRAQTAKHLETIQARQHHVEQSDGVVPAQSLSQTGFAVMRQRDVVAVPAEIVAQHRAQFHVVVDEEDRLHVSAPTETTPKARPQAAGNVTNCHLPGDGPLPRVTHCDRRPRLCGVF